jgi:7-cyano-7-deazaguanine reductase
MLARISPEEGHAMNPPATPGPTPATDQRWDVEGYERINAARLETFAYEYPGSHAVVEVSTDEFTAVCPWSGLPDFGRITVRYVPRERVLELKSFKYYLHSYRNVGIYQEHAANRILQDLVAVTEPQWMVLVLDYNVRGGVHTTVTVRWPQDAA